MTHQFFSERLLYYRPDSGLLSRPPKVCPSLSLVRFPSLVVRTSGTPSFYGSHKFLVFAPEDTDLGLLVTHTISVVDG